MTLKNVLKTMDKLNEKLEKLVNERMAAYDKRSDKWKESDSGMNYEDVTCALAELRDGIEDHIAELSAR